MKEDFTFKNLGILFTFYSIAYVYMYFGFYGINIFYYTDIQGVLTLFLSNVIKILIFSSLVLLVWALASEKSKLIKNESFNKYSLRKTLYFFILHFTSFIILFAFSLSRHESFLGEFEKFLIFYCVISILSEIDRLEKLIYYKFRFSAQRVKTYFFVFLAMPFLMQGLIAKEVMFFPKLDHLNFLYDNCEIIETGKKTNIYFIGKTSDNIFLFDKLKKQTLIYNMSDIKNFKMYEL